MAKAKVTPPPGLEQVSNVSYLRLLLSHQLTKHVERNFGVAMRESCTVEEESLRPHIKELFTIDNIIDDLLRLRAEKSAHLLRIVEPSAPLTAEQKQLEKRVLATCAEPSPTVENLIFFPESSPPPRTA